MPANGAVPAIEAIFASEGAADYLGEPVRSQPTCFRPPRWQSGPVYTLGIQAGCDSHPALKNPHRTATLPAPPASYGQDPLAYPELLRFRETGGALCTSPDGAFALREPASSR
jgi:hypothetical protein